MFSTKHRLTFLMISFLIVFVSACNTHSPPSEPDPTTTSVPIPTTDPDLPVLDCNDPYPPLITGADVHQAPRLDEPHARTPFRDPVFGTCIIRVTDRNLDIFPDDPSEGLKNEYSRVQSFNADESLLLARGIDLGWYLYDASTLQLLGQLPLEFEPRWSASDPYLIYYTSETRLFSFNIQSGATDLIRDFSIDIAFESPMVWTRHEGSPSADGRYWGVIAQDSEWLVAAYMVYDLETDAVIAMRDLRDLPDNAREVDSVTISLTGDYFLAFSDLYCAHGQLGSDSSPCGLMVYDRNLQNGRSLLRIVGHSDLAVDARGREVLVYQDIDTDHISMLDLESGQVTPLWPIDFSHTAIGFHFSGRAINRPGWVLVSTHDGDTVSHTWMDDQLFALELKPNGRIVHLAHTHSLVDENQEHDYWAEPHASVNRDFTRVLFTSNWGRSGTGEVEMYMVILPSNWWENLP